ncbi:MAG TPA: carboxypeptidase regulatory-like domain-containing protein [Pyrinomonadaceae bacterium]
MRSFLSSLLLIASILCGTSSAFAQGTSLGTIRGRVTDPTGAAVQNASVQVTDLETNITRELTTDDEGEYEATALKTGTYRVTVTGSGFASKAIRVPLAGSEPVRADVALEVSGAVENVEVVSEAGVIQTESSTIAGTITNQQLVELPRDNRDIYSFLFLNPNITQGATEDSFKFIGSQSYGAAFSLDGQRSNGGVFGTATTSQPSLEAISELTVLSNTFTAEYAGVANIRVQTKRGTKDFHGSLFYNNRNSALAAWTIQDKINRANFVPSFARPDYPKPYFNLNEAGGSLNGPVPFLSKGRTFFMGAYERRWTVSPTLFAVRVGATGAGVPGQRILDGDFSHLTDANKPNVPAAVLPLLTPTELANNTVLVGAVRRFITIPQRLLNPSVGTLIDTYFPSSSPVAPVNLRGALSDFAQNVTSRGTRDLVTGRIDHDFSDNDKFYAVYNYQNNPRTASQFAGAGYPAFGLLQNEQTNHTLSLSYTRVISPSLVNEARGGFNQQNLFRRSSRTLREFLTSIGFSGADITAYGNTVGASALDTPGHMAITIQNFAGIGAGGRSVNRTLDQKLATFGDTVTWIKGRHTIKGGFDIVRNSGTDGFVANRGNPRGLISYTNAAGESPTSAFARFLLGLPPTTVSFVDKLRGQMDVSNWEQGYFVQDEFKVHPKVTLNLGLRYELFTPFVDSENLLVNFDPNFTDPTTGRKGRFIVPTREVIPQLDPNIVAFGVVAANEIGLHRGLINPDKNNLAPRLGLAWRVTENTVLRGGYGVFYPTPAAQNIRDAFGSTPFNQGRTRRTDLTVAGSQPLGGFPGGLTQPGQTLFTGGVLNTFGRVPSANAIPVDLQQPRVQQFNVTVERELGWRTGLRLSYLASRMSGLVGGSDLNLIPPSDIPFGTSTGNGVTPCDVGAGNCVRSAADLARLPFPELGDFLLSYGNFGSGRSHALQVELNRRFASGLSFNVSYTLLDQKGSGFDVGASSLGGTSYNQFNPESDFGREAFVSRHRLVSYGVFELPFGRGKAFGKDLPGAVDAALGGWQLSWNMFAKSGTGFTPFWTCNNCGPVTLGNIASTSIDAIGGFNQSNAYRAVIVSGANLYSNTGDRFFNPDAFGTPPTGADVLDNPSVARRNVLTGPGTWGTNLGLRKFFRFNETTRLEIGADLNNAFNHPLRSPLDINFANLGSFDVGVNPANRQPIITNVARNVDFGRIRTSFNQEGIDNRRLIRLKLRFTF